MLPDSRREFPGQNKFLTGLLLGRAVMLGLVSIGQATLDWLLVPQQKRRKPAQKPRAQLAPMHDVFSEVSVAIADCPVEDIDLEINNGLNKILDAENVDRITWMIPNEIQRATQPIIYSARRDDLTAPLPVPSVSDLSWTASRMKTGNAVLASKLHDLPLQARVDIEILSQRHVKSIACIPLGSSVDHKGVVILECFTREHDWTEGLAGKIRMLGGVVNASLERREAFNANLISEQRFRNLFEQPLIGMAFEDLHGNMLQVNQELCSFLGYTEEELLAMRCDQFARVADAAEEVVLFRELQAGLRENYHIEKAYLRKDGKKVWGRLHVCRLHLPGDESPKVLAMVEDITVRKEAEQGLHDTQAALHELTGRLIQAQEDERRRIARELHDDIGQRLSLLMMELERISRETPVLSEAQFGSFANALQQVDEITKDIHQLSHQLHSTKLHYLGLRAALRELCQQVAKQQGITIDQKFEDAPDVPSDVQLCLYRVAQEALTNVAKHSRANKVSVSFAANNGVARLEVEDTGIGFDTETRAAGLGLASMRERLRIVQGEFAVRSTPGMGTRVLAVVPYADSASMDEAA